MILYGRYNSDQASTYGYVLRYGGAAGPYTPTTPPDNVYTLSVPGSAGPIIINVYLSRATNRD